MKITFHKYHGAGNDFILIDNRAQLFPTDNVKLVEHLCNRRLGIGSDGLILLHNHNSLAFDMRYYNADGNEVAMCGNGGRCVTAFALQLGVIGEYARFMASDGEHQAYISPNGRVRLHMIDVHGCTMFDNDYFLNTGVPHYVRFVDDVAHYPVFAEGRQIRHDQRVAPTNANFVQLINNNEIFVRTYERGVEDETLACGTGITASSIAAYLKTKHVQPQTEWKVRAQGGDTLFVSFNPLPNNRFDNVWLEGPTAYVYSGTIDI